MDKDEKKIYDKDLEEIGNQVGVNFRKLRSTSGYWIYEDDVDDNNIINKLGGLQNQNIQLCNWL